MRESRWEKKEPIACCSTREGRLTGMVSSCLPDISRNVDPEAFSSAHFLILSLIE